MSKRKPFDPLAQRDRLRDEITNAARAEAEARAEFARTEANIGVVQQERMALYTAKARGGDFGHEQMTAVANVEQELENTRSLLDSLTVQQSAARNAMTAATRERDALYREHLDAFAAEAEEATQAAMVAIEAVAAPLADAHRTWNHAVAVWAPLEGALRERVTEDENERGIWRDRSEVTRLAQVPPLTLPGPDFPRHHPPARPGFLHEPAASEIAGDGTFHVVDANAPLPELAE